MRSKCHIDGILHIYSKPHYALLPRIGAVCARFRKFQDVSGDLGVQFVACVKTGACRWTRQGISTGVGDLGDPWSSGCHLISTFGLVAAVLSPVWDSG